jgi:hypothetical protein
VTENAEPEAALRRAFVDHHADYIVITSRRQQFQIESANYGIGQGWLKGEWDERDEQSAAWICRLTDQGRKHFGLGGGK